MPELQMDVAVANRFISSLSKSLQALCHGCMDFDSGIEIVGYINVNIDCGSKVDYVLNEKVLKSTTNSMTFVSNSFLARKEQPKQTRDGTCSPIPELISPPVVSPFQNRARGYLHGMHPRNVGPVSHSNMHRGAQKRSWAGMERDWRMSPKKQRDGRPFYPSAHESGSTAPDTHSSPSSSSHPADSEFKYPQSSFQGSDANTVESQSEVNIKKEFLENDTDRETDQNEQDQSQTFDQSTNDNSDQVSGVANIKRDPDASSADVDDETSTADRPVNESDDYKDTFLEPSTSEDNQAVSEHNRHDSGAHDDSQTVSGGLAPETSSAEVAPSENTATGSEVQGEYDEGGEGAYPHSVYSDTGEGSSDAGQFEVIEIDDEDEDVQAMFGGPQKGYRTGTHQLHSQLAFNDKLTELSSNHRAVTAIVHPTSSSRRPRSRSSGGLGVSISAIKAAVGLSNSCQYCSVQFSSKSLLSRHMTDQHSEMPMAFPYNCAECGRGFFSQSGLNHHMESHFVKSECSMCGHTFKYSRNLKRHLEFTHHMKECRQCKCYINDTEFRDHVLRCTGQPKAPFIEK